MDDFHIEDESGDRKYFTIIPNYVLNHSTATAQALYLQLKRLAGEKGIAYPASRYLCKQLGVHHQTLVKELGYLLEKGWITDNGLIEVKTDGGPQKVRSYRITDLWKVNANHYQGGMKIEAPSPKGYENRHARGMKIDTKEDPSFKKNIPANAAFSVLKVNSSDEVIPASVPDPKASKYEELCRWAEARRGFRFVNRIKQFAALKKARKLDINLTRLKDRWVKCEGEDWREGFDWTTVVSSFDKTA